MNAFETANRFIPPVKIEDVIERMKYDEIVSIDEGAMTQKQWMIYYNGVFIACLQLLNQGEDIILKKTYVILNKKIQSIQNEKKRLTVSRIFRYLERAVTQRKVIGPDVPIG